MDVLWCYGLRFCFLSSSALWMDGWMDGWMDEMVGYMGEMNVNVNMNMLFYELDVKRAKQIPAADGPMSVFFFWF